jgi:hypothetical protein
MINRNMQTQAVHSQTLLNHKQLKYRELKNPGSGSGNFVKYGRGIYINAGVRVCM